MTLTDVDAPSAGESPAYPLRAVLGAALFHYGCYIVMQTLALVAETRRGPSLPDLLLDQFSARREFDWFNSSAWLTLLLLSIGILAVRRPTRCIAYLRAGGVVSLLRGLFIVLTSLGPPRTMVPFTPPVFLDFQLQQITWPLLLRQWFPLDVFTGGSGLSAAYLSQDLLFSGHTATTFLLLLTVGRRDRLFSLFLLYHLATVFFLVLTHEHYSIDILGAYFVVYAVFHFMRDRGLLGHGIESRSGPGP